MKKNLIFAALLPALILCNRAPVAHLQEVPHKVKVAREILSSLQQNDCQDVLPYHNPEERYITEAIMEHPELLEEMSRYVNLVSTLNDPNLWESCDAASQAIRRAQLTPGATPARLAASHIRSLCAYFAGLQQIAIPASLPIYTQRIMHILCLKEYEVALITAHNIINHLATRGIDYEHIDDLSHPSVANLRVCAYNGRGQRLDIKISFDRSRGPAELNPLEHIVHQVFTQHHAEAPHTALFAWSPSARERQHVIIDSNGGTRVITTSEQPFANL